MNKTFNINLGGHIFHIDDVAYSKLEAYINKLKTQFLKTEGGTEIIQDIESRLAELFKQRVTNAKEVITLSDVDEVIGIMGQPEDYLEADEEAQEQTRKTKSQTSYSTEFRQRKRIFRDPDDKMLGGVSSGIAAYFNIDAVWIRLLFVLALLSGFGFVFYIVLWIVIPEAKTTAEKLQMRGESVTVSNIEKSIREELDGLNTRVKDFSEKARNYNYRQHSTGLAGFFDDLIIFLKNLFTFVFKALGKVIGFAFILVAFCILVGVTVAILTGSIQLMHSNYSLSEVNHFMHLLALNNTHYYTFVIGAVISLLVPLFLIVYFGIRMLFHTPRLNKTARNSMWVLTGIGIILLISSFINFGVRVEDHGNYRSRQNLEGLNETVVLALPQDSLTDMFLHSHRAWIPTQNANAFKDVVLKIKPSNTAQNYIEVVGSAQGLSSREASEVARNIKFEALADSSKIEIPPYLLVPKNDRYRFQEVRATLYLKEGQSVYLAPDIIDVIYDIPNQNDYWDHDMTGHTWLMEKEGLICTDCPDTPQLRKMKIEGLKKGKMKLKIDEEGMELKIEAEPDTQDYHNWDDETEEDIEIELEEANFDLSYYVPQITPVLKGTLSRNFVVQL